MNLRVLFQIAGLACLSCAMGANAPAQDGAPATLAGDAPESTPVFVARMAERLEGFQIESGAISHEMPGPDGALRVVPYFSNLAALGWIEAARLSDDAGRREAWLQSTRDWMQWYAAHMNPDGTIYDFRGPAGELKPTNTYDSSDSYASTFGLLAWRYLELTSDTRTVAALMPALRQARVAIDLTRDVDGMTYATPLYGFKYLMDNCEVAIGLAAMARLFSAMNEPALAESCAAQVTQLRSAFALFYHAKQGVYGYAMDAFPVPLVSFKDPYPDAMANLMLLTWVSAGDAPARDLFDRLWREFWIAKPDSRSFPTWWVWSAAVCGKTEAYGEAETELRKQAAAPKADCVLVGMAAVTAASGIRALRFPELAIDWQTLTAQPEPAPVKQAAPFPEGTRMVITGNKLSSPVSHDGTWLGPWQGVCKLPYQLLTEHSYIQINLVFPGAADLSAANGLRLDVSDVWQSGPARRMELTLIEPDGDWWATEISDALAADGSVTIPFERLKRSEWGKAGDGKSDWSRILGVRLSLAAPGAPAGGIWSLRDVALAD